MYLIIRRGRCLEYYNGKKRRQLKPNKKIEYIILLDGENI